MFKTIYKPTMENNSYKINIDIHNNIFVQILTRLQERKHSKILKVIYFNFYGIKKKQIN